MREASRILAGALLGGLFIGALEFAQTQGLTAFVWRDQLLWLMRLVVHWSLSSLPLAAAVVILESRPRDVPAAHEYAIAIAIGALLGAGVMSLHGRYIDRGIGEWAVGEDLDLRARYLYGAWVLAFWGAAGALLHAADLRHKRYSERLRGAELARIARQQRLAQANLAALHSRFEPDRLLASLRAIEIAYGADMPAADRMLDELIRDSRSASRRTSA